jgi:hypothetical protein
MRKKFTCNLSFQPSFNKNRESNSLMCGTETRKKRRGN